MLTPADDILEQKPDPIMRVPSDGDDPIFAVIDHHRALSDCYTAACDQHTSMDGGPLETVAEEISDEACGDLLDFATTS
jgi:hypothetical protein